MKEIADQETSTDQYHLRFAGKIGSWFLEKQGTYVLDSIKDLKIESVLEVGGGHGQLVPYFLSRNFKITVLGSNQSCAHRLSFYLKDNLINFKVGNLIDLPFPDKSFDLVVAVRLLAHCHNWEKLIAEMTRVAKVAVVVDFPPKESFNFLYRILFKYKKNLEATTREYYIFSRSIICNQFNLNKFIPYRCLPQFFLPMVVYRKLNLVLLAKIFEFFFSLLGLTKFFGSPIIYCFKSNLKKD